MYACHVCSKYSAKYDPINYGYTLDGDIHYNIPSKIADLTEYQKRPIALGPLYSNTLKQVDFQDIALVDYSVIDLVNTLVNKWSPQVLQQSNNSALLSINLPYNYNIDVAGVCALQVLINHFAVDVHTTISCDAFDSPHLCSDDNLVLRRQYYAIHTRSPSVPKFSSGQELRPVPVAMCANSQCTGVLLAELPSPSCHV